MKFSKRLISVLSVTLVFELIVAGASLSIASSANKSIKSVEVANYSSAISPNVSASVKENMLYNSTSVSNPHLLFHNITNGIFLSIDYSFYSNIQSAGEVTITIVTTLISGTDPQWTKNLTPVVTHYQFDTSSFYQTTNVSLKLNATLQQIYSIDQQLNLAPNAPSILVNATDSVSWENSYFYNYTTVDFSFAYPPYFSGPFNSSNWSYATIAITPDAQDTGTMLFSSVTKLSNDQGLYVALAVTSGILAVVLSGLLTYSVLPAEVNKYEKILRSNKDNIIRVAEDPRSKLAPIQLRDLQELLKLSELSGKPIFLFEAQGSSILFSANESNAYFVEIPKLLVGENDFRVTGHAKLRKLKRK